MRVTVLGLQGLIWSDFDQMPGRRGQSLPGGGNQVSRGTGEQERGEPGMV